MATAVFIKSSGCDYYLFCYEDTLTKEEAKAKAEEDCLEDSGCWDEFIVENS